MGGSVRAKDPEELRFKVTKRKGRVYLRVEYKEIVDFDGGWVLNLELTPEKAQQLAEAVLAKLGETGERWRGA